ncbi:MAG: hypothetical protein HY815_23290 [Candidatus Riflebacteria bacterium]|nr:hypothetical protein [Candidatus Riflebacteria bacterium]
MNILSRSTLVVIVLTALGLEAASPALAAGPLCPATAPELFSRTVRSSAPRVARGRSLPVEVGTARLFWAWDLAVMPPGFKRVSATCRFTGARSIVFVEDAEWGVTVQPADVAAVADRFEISTPQGALDPARGIGDLTASVFGEFPTGLDGEHRVVLLLVKLDRFNGGAFDGYFNAFDTISESEAQAQGGQHSNETNILYLNTRGSPISSDYMLGVLAHELQHLVHQPRDPEEVSWVNESLSEAAMVVCGYPIDTAHLERFARKPETPLVTDGFVSYGACFLFGTYLYEQLGPAALRRIVEDPAHGTAGLEPTLLEAGRGQFGAFLEDWAVANHLASAPGAAPRYGYRSFPVPALTLRQVPGLPAEDAGQLAAHKVRYLRLPAGPAIRVALQIEPSTATVGLSSIVGAGPDAAVTRLLTAPGTATVPAATTDRVLLLRGTQARLRETGGSSRRSSLRADRPPPTGQRPLPGGAAALQRPSSTATRATRTARDAAVAPALNGCVNVSSTTRRPPSTGQAMKAWWARYTGTGPAGSPVTSRPTQPG